MADQAEGKHCSLWTPEGKPPHRHPPAPTSLSHGHCLLLERENLLPSREPAAWRGLPWALHIHWLPSCSYLSIVIMLGLDPPQAAMLSSFSRELGRVLCFQGQLNSPRNLTHNFHFAHNFFAAGSWAGLGGLLALLCFRAVIPRGCLGGRPTFPSRA